MSVITVQLGQCGNQVGCSLYHTLSEYTTNECEASRDSPSLVQNSLGDVFFRERAKGGRKVARAVLIDMEPKVISEAVNSALKSESWVYGDNSSFSRQRGSANNWAFGYTVHGPQSESSILDLFRAEVEQADSVGGFHVLQSLAGGTGSGVGTYATQILRDEYPKSFLWNQVVWPYTSGEVIVQNYNAVLTLSHLYENSDAIGIIENDVINDICTRLLKIRHPTFDQLNSVIAGHLGGVLAPSAIPDESLRRRPLDLLSEPLEFLVSHPSFKLLSTRAIPQMPRTSIEFQSDSWYALMKPLRQMVISDSKIENQINWNVAMDPNRLGFFKSVSNWLVLRGDEAEKVDISQFQDPGLSTPWQLTGTKVLASTSNRRFAQYPRSAFLVSNSQTVVDPLRNLVSRAYDMHKSGAYLHHYSRYGIEDTDLLEGFVLLEQVAHDYEHMY